MALVTCPECSAGVSQHAASCPHCGYPIAASVPMDPLQQLAQTQALGYQARGAAPARRPRVQTVEQTGKIWKLQMLLSALVSMAGVVMAGVGYSATMDSTQAGGPLLAVGVLMLFGGLGWFIVARIGAWWCHG